MELEVLKIWPDWQATRLIGEGSFGKVYEIVRNRFSIEEHCALKVISIPSSRAELDSMRNEGMDDESITTYYRGMVEEFVQEIAMMSRLKGNINIVSHEDYAVIEHKKSIGWDILIRMELLTALPNYIRQNELTELDVINLSTDMCNALEICQQQSIIHRDIKLDNIFVSKDKRFKLGDFGVARTIDKNVSGLSKKGTYTYMAPEVYRGENYGMNVDLYSLGIVMYKLLNNNREPFLPPHPQPITHTSKNEALVKRLSGEIIPPPANASAYMKRIILKSCNFDPKNRYQSATQMKNDLISVRDSMKMGTAPVLSFDATAAANTNSTAKSRKETKTKTNIFSGTFNNAKRNNVGNTHVNTRNAPDRQKKTDFDNKQNNNGYQRQGAQNINQGAQNRQYYQNNNGYVNGNTNNHAETPSNNYANNSAKSSANHQGYNQSYQNKEKPKLTNKDIYEMSKSYAPHDLNTPQSREMMENALRKVVPSYVPGKNLVDAIKKSGLTNVRNNVLATDTDTLFVLVKAATYQLSKGVKASDISVIVYNVYETLKRRF